MSGAADTSEAPPAAPTPAAFVRRKAGWRWWEAAVWAAALGALLVFPDRASLLNEIAILALFALSLDLILGYAGIVSLGHAAFFGVAAYAAGLFAKHVSAEPVLGLAAAMGAAGALGFATSFLVIRGSDLTRLMVTLGVSLMLYEAANRLDWLTGGSDGLLGIVMGPVLGLFPFDFAGRTAYLYSLAVLFLLFLVARRLVHSPFGLSVKAVRDNALRATAVGVSPARRVVAIYTLAATYAGAAGALLAQTTAFVSLEALDFQRSADGLLVLVIGGAGYLYGGILGAVAYKLLKDVLSGVTPAYWLFWMGLFLVTLVLVGRERLQRWPAALLARLRGRGA